MKLAVRSGGHSYAGYSVSDGDGVTLDLSRMAAVAVAMGNSSADPSCSVTVGAGTQWMEVGPARARFHRGTTDFHTTPSASSSIFESARSVMTKK